MSWLRRPWLHDVLAIAVGLVFLYAAHEKIERPEAFARAIYHYQLIGPNDILPALLPNLLGVVLPWVEVLAGILLIRGLWRREAALLTAAMLIAFIVAVASTLVRGIDIENCGCFSLDAHGRAAGLTLILQDLGLLAAALVLAFVSPRRAALDKARRDP
jgi:putative oxidoreductase